MIEPYPRTESSWAVLMVGRVIGVVQELQPLQQRLGGAVLAVGIQRQADNLGS